MRRVFLCGRPRNRGRAPLGVAAMRTFCVCVAFPRLPPATHARPQLTCASRRMVSSRGSMVCRVQVGGGGEGAPVHR